MKPATARNRFPSLRTLAALPRVQQQAEAHRYREEIVEMARAHQRLVAMAVELRGLGCAYSAHMVTQDARFFAGFVGKRAWNLGYGIVTVCRAAERAADELHPFKQIAMQK
jgi:hypothetical protein